MKKSMITRPITAMPGNSNVSFHPLLDWLYGCLQWALMGNWEHIEMSCCVHKLTSFVMHCDGSANWIWYTLWYTLSDKAAQLLLLLSRCLHFQESKVNSPYMVILAYKDEMIQ